MARQTFEAWIPEEYSGPVLAKMTEISAVEAYARPEPMATDTKHVPRSGGATFQGAIAKGAAYPEDATTNDEVLLTARKLGEVVRVADEDVKDISTVANVIQTKQLDWARAYAVGFDNATLGVTAAENGGTIPFTSLYKALSTTNAATGYTANDNKITSITAVAVTYADLSNLLGLVEGGDYWDDGSAVIIAHPAYKKALRGIVDTTGRPLFGESMGANGSPAYNLLGVGEVRFSLGAKTHATASSTPSGNPLLFVGNPRFLIKGVRSGPEYMVAGADSGAAFLTDEHLLKMRVRRGFAVAHEKAWAVLEDVA